MFPGIDQRALKQAMKKMGIKEEVIEASEVIIKCKDKELIIKNPKVSKVNMMGQETLQISGEIHEKELSIFSEEDIKTIMEQAKCSREEAVNALKKENDIAAAILSLTG
ncbi:Nascent polypeptide-associated complex protein [Candidatus Woesearchaeota archaeon]|nr:Nascent polypeptide-associated complex protein [Candidatus Woesearchaeota archaeon]